MKRRRGFTLIELMIAMAVLLVVVAYLTEMLTRQSRAYTVVDQVTEAQQNLRAIADLLERELRVTGFLVPEGAAVCGVDQTNGSDVLYVSDADALDPTNANQLGLGASILAGFAGTGGAESLTLDDEVIDGLPFYDTDGDGNADSDFLESVNPLRNGGVIVADRGDPTRGVSCGIVTSVNSGSNTITVDFTSNGAAPAGTPLKVGGPGDLVAVPAHVYMVANNAGGNSQLLRDGMVLADDVEDLQFAFFYDTDGDGLEVGDGSDYPGSADYLPGYYESKDWNNSELTEIRVNIVVRTRAEDADVVQNPGMAQGSWQVTENRVDPGGFDGFRRRVHTAIVRPRNVGLRPVGSV
jgi:prepilin-type N-terminal cleavage/methylation domain-containing protein